MRQFNYVLKRLLYMIPVLLCVTLLIFLMIRLIPGSPAEIMLGDKATPEKVAILEAKMGLDKPLYVQYFYFLKQLFTLDFGDSIKYARPVVELIGPRLVVTGSLVAMTMLFVVLVSFPLGYIAGSKQGSIADTIIQNSALIVISLPQFWVATMLMLLLGLKVRWFPIGGWGEGFWGHVHSLILPSIAGALSTMALTTRNLRTNVIDVINSEYVDFARSKGLTEGRITSRHVLRNSMISTVTLLALRMANMLGGSIVIETVFSLPGLGKLLVDSIFARDYAVVQIVVLMLAFVVLMVNLLVDILYSMLDPRVKLE